MLGRPTGSLALTLAFAVVSTASAFSLAALVMTPGTPVRSVAEALLRDPDGSPDVRIAAEADEPDSTGSIVLPLRRGE